MSASSQKFQLKKLWPDILMMPPLGFVSLLLRNQQQQHRLNNHHGTRLQIPVLVSRRLHHHHHPRFLHTDVVALALAAKKIIPNTKRIRQKPRKYEKVWEDLNCLLLSSSNNQKEEQKQQKQKHHDDSSLFLSAEESLQILKEPFLLKFDKKIDFSMALFKALRRCLKSYELQQQHQPPQLPNNNDSHTMILKIGNTTATTDEYAVGLIRRCHHHHHRQHEDFHMEQGDARVWSMDKIASTTSQDDDDDDETTLMDHAVCLFRKECSSSSMTMNNSDRRYSSNWVVKDYCFSVVNLKMSDDMIHDDGHQQDRIMFLKNPHGALGQVTLHTMECVLPCHASRGVLSNSVPLAVIAGTKKNTTDSDDQFCENNSHNNNNNNNTTTRRSRRMRWVSGRLDIPIACGQSFEYGVTDFGYGYENDDKEQEQQQEEDEENASVINALSVYLDTILFGLSHAISVQKNLASNTVMPPVPMSGQSLMIGDTTLNLRLCASPILRGDNRFDESWSVSQGELFSGRLNMNNVLQRCELDARFDFYDKNDHNNNNSNSFCENEEMDVVVKVSSPTVHNMLITPGAVFEALERVNNNRKLVKEIGTVLLSVIWQEVGLITIMADLSKQGYTILKPKDHRDQLAVLWAGYQELVEKVLLPLAEMNVLHPDIRPGYDVTSNILCKIVTDDGNHGRRKAILKLIDYDSLVWFRFWDTPQHDGRYLNRKRTRNAIEFVWWQCVCLAYTWHHKELDASTLRQGRHLDALMDDYYGSRNMTWWKEIGIGISNSGDHYYCSMDSECVREILGKLAQTFEDVTT